MIRRTVVPAVVIALAVTAGALLAHDPSGRSPANPCADPAANVALRSLLSLRRAFLAEHPVGAISSDVFGPIDAEGFATRYEFTPSLSSVRNVDLHLAALDACIGGIEPAADAPSIVATRVGPLGCGAAPDDALRRDLENLRELTLASGAADTSAIDSQLARLDDCAPEG